MKATLVLLLLGATFVTACGDDESISNGGGGEGTTSGTTTGATRTGAGGETGAGGDASTTASVGGGSGVGGGGAGGGSTCGFERPDLTVSVTFTDGAVADLASDPIDRTVVGTLKAVGTTIEIEDDSGATTIDLVGTSAPPLALDTDVELRVVGTEIDTFNHTLHVEVVDVATDALVFATSTGWVSVVEGGRAVFEPDAIACTYAPQDGDDYTKEAHDLRVTVDGETIVVPQRTVASVPGTDLEVEHQTTLFESLYEGSSEEYFQGVVVRRVTN